MGQLRDLTGQVFGRLTVLFREEFNCSQGKPMWRVQCSCEEATILSVRASALHTGHTLSCGCLQKEAASKLHKGIPLTEARKENLRLANTGRKASKETRLKLSISHTGKTGALASNWQGGIYSENDNHRHDPEQKEWAADVKGRDYYTCQECNQRGVKLISHHILRYSIYPELRLILCNGITLCKTCHLKVRGHEEEMEEYFLNKLFNFM